MSANTVSKIGFLMPLTSMDMKNGWIEGKLIVILFGVSIRQVYVTLSTLQVGVELMGIL
jgi:hypothetical protein